MRLLLQFRYYLGFRFRVRLIVGFQYTVSIVIRVKRRNTNTITKAAAFTGLLPQSRWNRDSFDRKHSLSVWQGNHVHKAGTNKKAIHLKTRLQELNDDCAVVLYHMHLGLEEDMDVSLNS